MCLTQIIAPRRDEHSFFAYDNIQLYYNCYAKHKQSAKLYNDQGHVTVRCKPRIQCNFHIRTNIHKVYNPNQCSFE